MPLPVREEAEGANTQIMHVRYGTSGQKRPNLPNSTYCILLYELIFCILFQCVVITIGDRGFNTEWIYDDVLIEDSSGKGISNII